MPLTLQAVTLTTWPSLWFTTILIKIQYNEHNLLVFYERWKKYNEIQLTKNKMDLRNRNLKNNPPSPILYNNTWNVYIQYIHGHIYNIILHIVTMQCKL